METAITIEYRPYENSNYAYRGEIHIATLNTITDKFYNHIEMTEDEKDEVYAYMKEEASNHEVVEYSEGQY